MGDERGMSAQNPQLVALVIFQTGLLLYFLWCVFQEKEVRKALQGNNRYVGGVRRPRLRFSKRLYENRS